MNWIKDKIKTEVEKFKQFNQIVLGIKNKITTNEIGIRNYAKYNMGRKDLEKRELLDV